MPTAQRRARRREAIKSGKTLSQYPQAFNKKDFDKQKGGVPTVKPDGTKA